MLVLNCLSLLAILTPAFALTYYLSDSCEDYPGVRRALAEAIQMGKRSDARLGANDEDIQAAFQWTFNTNTANSDSVKEVRRIMSGISQMSEDEYYDSADIRIYCDQDARWVLQKDKAQNSKNLGPNSKRAPEDQLWIDRPNGIYFIGVRACTANPTTKPEIGRVYTVTYGNDANYKLQPPARATMTLCQPFVNAEVTSIEDVNDQDFTGFPLTDDALKELLSVTIMHELTHMPAFGTGDILPPYGWENIIKKSAEVALLNADNYAFLGLLSILGDLGFKLSTNEQDAQNGVLVRTTATYPKRSVTAPKSLSRCKDRSVRSRDPKCNVMARGVASTADLVGMA